MFVECVCSYEETLRRLAQRQAADDDVSDADAEVDRKQKAGYEPYATVEAADHLALDTESTSGEVAVRRVETRLRQSVA